MLSTMVLNGGALLVGRKATCFKLANGGLPY